MAIDLSSLNVYLVLAVNGLFCGLGSSIGTYIAQKHLIGIPNKLKKRIKKKIKRRRNKNVKQK